MCKAEISLVVLGAVAGLMCVIVPSYLLSGGVDVAYSSPLAPWLTTAYEHLRYVPSLISFFVDGLLLGALRPKRWLSLGLSTVLVPPLVIFGEIALSPTSHNLWPAEIGVYASFGLVAVVGAFVGSRFNMQRS